MLLTDHNIKSINKYSESDWIFRRYWFGPRVSAGNGFCYKRPAVSWTDTWGLLFPSFQSFGYCFVDKIMHFLAVFWDSDDITILYLLCVEFSWSHLRYIPPLPLSLSSIHPTWRWVCDFFLFCFIWGFLFRFVFKPPPTAPFLFEPHPLFTSIYPWHPLPTELWLFLHSLLGCPTSRGLTWKWPIPACAKWPPATGSSPRATGRAC